MALRRRDRHARGVLGERAALAGQVGLGEERDLQRRRDEAAVEAPGRDLDDAGVGIDRGDEPAGHLGGAEPLDRPLGRAVAVEDQHHAPALTRPAPHLVHRGVGVAGEGRRRLELRCVMRRRRVA